MSLDNRAPRRRFSKVQWLLVGFLVLANLVVFGAYLLLREVEGAFQAAANRDEEVVAELSAPPVERSEPVTFLVIGSDSREGLEDLTNFGSFEGARGDVIMLVKVSPEDRKLQILSIPRDLWVEIPGHGENRINAAYGLGGASLMVRTVRQLTGLPVHHYAEVDFVGFQAIVDKLGGVTLDFPYPARDRKSGLRVEAGPQTLDGQMALAFARARNYQELRGDQWIATEANDVGRTHRQQQLVLAILRAIKRPSSIAEAGNLVETFARHLTIDASLAERSVVDVAFQLRGLTGGKIETATLPGTDANIGGASVLLLKQPEAGQLLASFAAGGTINTSQTPTLAVLNGNGVKGSAGRWSDVLREKGFAVTKVADADRDDFQVTQVIVRSDYLEGGLSIVEALGFGEVVEGAVESAFDAVVIVGADAVRAAQNG